VHAVLADELAAQAPREVELVDDDVLVRRRLLAAFLALGVRLGLLLLLTLLVALRARRAAARVAAARRRGRTATCRRRRLARGRRLLAWLRFRVSTYKQFKKYVTLARIYRAEEKESVELTVEGNNHFFNWKDFIKV
jgi:hypothetical protein